MVGDIVSWNTERLIVFQSETIDPDHAILSYQIIVGCLPNCFKTVIHAMSACNNEFPVEKHIKRLLMKFATKGKKQLDMHVKLIIFFKRKLYNLYNFLVLFSSSFYT